MPEDLRRFIIYHLNVSDSDVFRLKYVDTSDIQELIDVDRPDLLFPSYHIRFPERIRDYGERLFRCHQHQRYHWFITPMKVLTWWSSFYIKPPKIPDVVSIKQTLYRTSEDSPIVEALIATADAGKSVTAMVELKARFDEAANIDFARRLERSGAQVIFGFMDLKTHAKLSLCCSSGRSTVKILRPFGYGQLSSRQCQNLYRPLFFYV